MSGMHLYPMGKGDPLCPLGFHPQVRWPTRCKRCFRDYKEHGGKRKDSIELRKDDVSASTPSLGDMGKTVARRIWTSSSNLALKPSEAHVQPNENGFAKNPSSWTSTPDLANLEDDTQASIPTVSLTLPLRRKQVSIDTGQRSVSDNVPTKPEKSATVFKKSDSLATRAKILQIGKEKPRERTPIRRIHIEEVRPTKVDVDSNDVQFLIQVRPKKVEDLYKSDSLDLEDDNVSLTGTDVTESTTLVDQNEFGWKNQYEQLKTDYDTIRSKCERLEKEKSNILLRRLTAMDTSKTNSSEHMKLQQKVNELQTQLDSYKDDKKLLNLKVKELENNLDTRPTTEATIKVADELRSKLLAAETLCEELMDENEDMKKELRELEEEMEEMQDNFREDQATEYTTLKKELEQTTKNCRILSFKLRKTERKTEQLESEKIETDKKLRDVTGSSTFQYLEKIKQLEKDLANASEHSSKLQKNLDDVNAKLKAEEINKLPMVQKRKAPMLGNLGKSASSEMKISRESLTRGGSQDDPVQLLRDLQDTLEREADLREQLKFAEEEAETLRKKASRIEDDNESLVLQLKKMATRTRTRKLTPVRGIEERKDEDDPTELKLQLELSEQETSVLRKKVEELEVENEHMRKKTKNLQDRLVTVKPADKLLLPKTDKLNIDKDEKIKTLELEMNEVRKKLIEKERDYERLETEINVTKKRSSDPKIKSFDIDQQTLDMKRQLQVIEQEAEVFRNKAQTLEAENERLQTENKRLEIRGTKNLKADKSVDQYINKIADLEIELSTSQKKIEELEGAKTKVNGDIPNTKQLKLIEKERDKLQTTLNKIKENSFGAFANRKACVPTELTTKLQLKKMVNDLENEIGAILTTLGNAEKSKLQLEEQLQNKDKTNTDSNETTKTTTKIEELKKTINNLDDEKESLLKELKKLKTENEKAKQVSEELTKLKTENSLVTTKYKELLEFKDKYNNANKENMKYESEINKLKDEISDKTKELKEATTKSNKILKLQKELKELEESNKKTDKLNVDKIKQLEDKLDEEKNKTKLELQDSNTKLLDESKKYNSKIKELENGNNEKNTTIEKLEKDLEKEKKKTSVAMKGINADTKENKLLKEEITKLKAESSDNETKFKESQKNVKLVEDKLTKIEGCYKLEKDILDKKIADISNELQAEQKKTQLMKTNHDKEQKNREYELGALKNKIKTLETNALSNVSKYSDIKEHKDKIQKLEDLLSKEKKHYETLTAKYEVLEEEHVVTKAKLVTEKEALASQILALNREVDNEQCKFKEKIDTLIREKAELVEKAKEAANNSNEQLEKMRLKMCLEEKQSELEQLKREHEVVQDQMEYLRHENDELRRKLDDFDKVTKVQRNISADTSAMEYEIRQLKSKVSDLEKTKKTDVTQCKLRYEGQITVLNEEMKSLHNQVSRFKRERDTYKHMLEGAQKTIGDLKTQPITSTHRFSTATEMGLDDVEEFKSKITGLEQQVSCMEDELSESRLEASKLRTDLVSERSSFDIKLAELQSHVNELEEEKILISGRTKIAGLRTRMELAWHKEREEQHRLLQETATLARDLRQTLFEVERERDKEILEGKRKADQLKKLLDEEQDENKKKLTDLQCDFMELRDAHAKLRTTNEKLRREKERYEREREEMKFFISGRRRSDQEDGRRINTLIAQVEQLLQVAPELFGAALSAKDRNNPGTYTPTPPKRLKSKSREGSPLLERKDYGSRESSIVPEDKMTRVQSTLQRLVDAAEELRRCQKMNDEDREHIKRQPGLRRATSTENDRISGSSTSVSSHANPRKSLTRTDSSLHRKSLSLEHTSTIQDHNIWIGEDDSLTSLQSLDANSDIDFRRSRRDASLDSRLSGGSTQSEVVGDRKKKKGLMGKLKKLTKSRSIDDQENGEEHFSPTRPLSSKQNSMDLDETKGSKKDLKERITGIFKRAGSSSRSNSVERHDTSSTQRPLMKTGSNANIISRDSSVERLNKSKKTRP